MKRLLLVLVLLMTAGSLFAAELKITGNAHVRGTTISTDDDAALDAVQYSYFDYDFNLFAALMVNENASIHMKLTYDKDVVGPGPVADGTGAATDVGLALERAFIAYKFAPFFQVRTGLMQGGTFATTFGDTEANRPRVQLIGALSPDMVFAFTYEKLLESGAAAPLVKDAENGDFTVYYLSGNMKFDALRVLPLAFYGIRGAESYAPGSEDYTFIGLQLGLNGDFGMFGFESEFHYRTDTAVGGVDGADWTRYGAYINAYAKVDALKVGLMYVYMSADLEDGVQEQGVDFNPLYVATDLVLVNGFSIYGVYGEYKIDKITAKAAFAYGADNMEDSDRTFMEFDLGASYAMDANASYNVGLGYATFGDWTVAGDMTKMRLFHSITMNF